MFTQPCIIRKNTEELREKLKDLGLCLMNSGNTTLDGHNYDGKGNHRSIEEGTAIITYLSPDYGVIYDVDSVALKNRFDCGTNEDLFLAMAALRDDTDKNQWFVYDDKDDNPDERQILWFICEKDDIRHDMWHDQAYLDCHKATVQELIQHFKDK